MTNDTFGGNYDDGSQAIESWWEEAHSKRDQGWLSGTEGPDEWETLRIASLVKAGRSILNIGVGLGNGTLALHSAGCRVSAMDISPKALAGVRDKVEKTYLASNIEQLPDEHFDLALSHLVAQHLSDEELARQFNHVVRSLKDSGIFALQFATSWDQAPGTINDNLVGRKVGAVCRTLGRVTELAEAANARISFAMMVGTYPQYKSSWYTAHLFRHGSESVGIPKL